MEQVNSWYSKFNSSTRYMNHARFEFFVILVCHLNNKYREYKRRSMAIEELENEDTDDFASTEDD